MLYRFALRTVVKTLSLLHGQPPHFVLVCALQGFLRPQEESVHPGGTQRRRPDDLERRAPPPPRAPWSPNFPPRGFSKPKEKRTADPHRDERPNDRAD